ncbi:MAG: glycosyltransferase family 39 protein, partial [Chloroflexi bacterium]|nr:glycosyltransferase family 39 protein [Chloroflexota bacterium]
MISAVAPARAILPRNAASRTAAACLALVILAVFAWRMVVSVPGNSVTYDESVHVTRGYAALKYHDLRLNIEHPVLGDALAALPLLADSRIQFPLDSAAWRSAEHWVLADEFLWHLNRQPQAMVNSARYSAVVMSILLAVVIAAWAADLYGWAGALFALLLYTLSPTVIANSILATNDLSLALFSTLYTWLLWRFTRKPSFLRGVLCALALAAAVTCKYSGLVLAVDTLLLLPVAGWYWRKHVLDTAAGRASSKWLWDAVAQACAIILGAAVLVW